MSGETFYATYPGEMNHDDRVALDRPGMELFENGYGVAAAPYQLVKVKAGSADEARRIALAACFGEQLVEAAERSERALRPAARGPRCRRPPPRRSPRPSGRSW